MKRIFYNLKRLPHAGLIIGLTVLAGLSEGLGLVLFIPLVGLITGEKAESPGAFAWILRGFESAGLPMNPWALMAAIVGLTIISFGLILLHKVMVTRSQFQLTHQLRIDLISALLGSRWEYLSRQSGGEVLSSLIQAAERAGAAMHHFSLFIGGVSLLAIYGAMSTLLSWELLLMTGVMGAGLILATRPLIRRATRFGQEMTKVEQGYAFQSVDYIKGAKLIKATGSEREACAKVIDLGEGVTQIKTQAHINGYYINFLMQAGPVALVAVSIVLGVAVLELPAAVILVFLLAMSRIAPRLAAIQQFFEAYSVNADGLHEIDRQVAAMRAREEPENEKGAMFDRLAKEIRLDDVTFTYENADADAVANVDLTIPKNAMAAFVGTSGSGKSTLIEVIAGMRPPTKGRVLVDGVDLQGINVRSWRKRIGFVTQDTIIFNDSLRNNLLFSHPDADDAALARAIETAHLTDVVAELPQGLDTPLGEGGVRLSGGQKQRVALARALVGDPELLLLDEATSALDNESERHVQEAIESVAKTLTIVVIAHRLSTVRNADRIYVMEQGRLAEQGSFEELQNQGGRFSQLSRSQFN